MSEDSNRNGSRNRNCQCLFNLPVSRTEINPVNMIGVHCCFQFANDMKFMTLSPFALPFLCLEMCGLCIVMNGVELWNGNTITWLIKCSSATMNSEMNNVLFVRSQHEEERKHHYMQWLWILTETISNFSKTCEVVHHHLAQGLEVWLTASGCIPYTSMKRGIQTKAIYIFTRALFEGLIRLGSSRHFICMGGASVQYQYSHTHPLL